MVAAAFLKLFFVDYDSYLCFKKYHFVLLSRDSCFSRMPMHCCSDRQDIRCHPEAVLKRIKKAVSVLFSKNGTLEKQF